MYRKRTLPSSFTNTSYTPPRKRSATITLSRPTSYRTNYQYQQYLKRKNQRTGGFVGKELKFADYSVVAANFPTTWTLWDPSTGALNAVAQGNSESQRIGRKISNTSLHIRGMLNGSTNSTGVSCRIVVFKDNQSNGAAPTPANVMTSGINGFRNLEYVSRFQVLVDKVYNINPSISHNSTTGALNSSSPNRHVAFNMNIPSETTFDGTTADISDITDCSYHVMVIADIANACAFSYSSRFRYYG